MRLNKLWSAQRLEAACQRANFVGATSFRSVQSILEKGADSLELTVPKTLEIEHENVIGSEDYQTDEKGELLC